MSDKTRFNEDGGGKTMIDGYSADYFNSNFSTDQLTLYSMRIAQGKSPARVRYISRDRGYSDRTWQGDIAEVLIYDRQLTDDEISQVNQYLMQKFEIQ